MKDFMLLRDALTDDLMLVRKSMIFKVEECHEKKKQCRRIIYVDRCEDDFVTEALIDILNELEKDS